MAVTTGSHLAVMLAGQKGLKKAGETVVKWDVSLVVHLVGK